MTKERERGAPGREPREEQGEGRPEGRSSKGIEGGVRRDRARSRPPLSPPLCSEGPEEDKEEEEEGLLFVGEFGQRGDEHLRVRGSLRGATKGSSTLTSSSWCPSGSRHAGNADKSSHGDRWSMASRSNGHTTSGLPVLWHAGFKEDQVEKG